MQYALFLIKLLWYKIFVHSKQKLLNVLVDSVLKPMRNPVSFFASAEYIDACEGNLKFRWIEAIRFSEYSKQFLELYSKI